MTFKMLYVNLKLSFIYLNPRIKTTNLPVLQNFTRGPCAQNEIFYFVVVTSQKPKRKKKKKNRAEEGGSLLYPPWEELHTKYAVVLEINPRFFLSKHRVRGAASNT